MAKTSVKKSAQRSGSQVSSAQKSKSQSTTALHSSVQKSKSQPNSAEKSTPQPRPQLTTKNKIQLAIIILVFLALIIYVIWDVLATGPVTTLFNNRDQVIDFINSAGPLGPLIFILLQIFQTVAAPIPGNIVGGVGGFLFGWWGILWTVIGSAIGCFIVFYLSRRFGRPLVERLIKPEALDKFDFISGESAPFILFLIFLIPGLPDDVVCYVAGLTKVPIRQLMALVVIGRFPAVVVTNYIGAGLGADDLTPVIVAIVLTVILLAIIAIKRNTIIDFLQKKSQSDRVDDALEKFKYKDADAEMKDLTEHKVFREDAGSAPPASSAHNASPAAPKNQSPVQSKPSKHKKNS